MTLYTNAKCWKCDMDLSIPTHDLAERNYCQTCAFDKLGGARIPSILNEGDAND